MMTVEQGVKEIMAILGEGYDDVQNETAPAEGGAHVTKTISTISPSIEVKVGVGVATELSKPVEVVYENGVAIAVNGKSVAVGYKKGARKVNNSPKDKARTAIADSAMVVLNRVKAFEGKVFLSKTEGIVIKLADADYTVKVTGHAKPEFADRGRLFTPERNYITRGQGENHTSAIAKFLVTEIENENSILKIENQKSIALLSAKASMVRFEIENLGEFSFRITKKRSRIAI